MLIFDLAGEIRTPSLRDRLLSVDLSGHFSYVLLRGASQFLREEIADGEGKLEFEARFPGTPVWLVDTSEHLDLLPLNDGATAAASLKAQLFAWCAQAEVEATLVWNNAIWHDRSYHFILPSGHHADKFIRLGDVFVDPLNVGRIADWCARVAIPPCILVADTFTLLPLLQELELRWLRQALLRHQATSAAGPPEAGVAQEELLGTPAGVLPKFILPLYGMPEDIVRERLAEIVPVARERGIPIIAIVSVSASGGYVTALQDSLSTFAEPPELQVIALCRVGDANANGIDALCHIDTRSFPDRESCSMCLQEQSTPIEIDQQRLTTRLGVKMLQMPKASVMEEASLVIRDADPHCAFRVHVDRDDRHGHLAVYIDTVRFLESRVFRAKATLGLARSLTGFSPDLVLIPKHDATAVLRSWIESEQVTSAPPIEVAIDEPLPDDVASRILAARAILLVDDAVITGRTLLALLETVQRVKSDIADGAFELRGFVLVARPASSDTWKRLRDRFYIHNQHGLYAGWEINLPDVGVNGREVCPWCVEMRFLRNVIPLLPESARPYAELRLGRLSDPAGLSEAIFLGAECALGGGQGPGWNPAIHTTPGSYLGNVSDVGAYVGAAALLQSMRDDWGHSPERWSMGYAMPLAKALVRFTDPVIVAGLLRGIKAAEVWSGQTEDELNAAVRAFDHEALHGVLAAEVLLAARQRKLPQGVDTDAFQARLGTLPNEIRVGLEALLRHGLASPR